MGDSNGDDERFRKRREEMTALHLARAGLVRVGHMPIRDVFTLMKETPWLRPYLDAPVANVVERLSAGESAAIAGPEIAAALWALVRRRDPALSLVVARVAREAEILVARACVRQIAP